MVANSTDLESFLSVECYALAKTCPCGGQQAPLRRRALRRGDRPPLDERPCLRYGARLSAEQLSDCCGEIKYYVAGRD